MTHKKIIDELRKIHKKNRLKSKDITVSEDTKSAQKITKEWQEKVCTEELIAEVSVSDENKERIDIVDIKNNIAYELKVSGNNSHHEFYKDLIKVLTYNLNYKDKLEKFVFISEVKGIKSINNRLDSKFLEMMGKIHKITIILEEI